MAWFRRRKDAPRTSGRSADRADLEYLAEFVRSRRGVEGYIEPRTTVTETTLLLIAHDGEWTRRALPSRPAAFEVARSFDIPVYDVNLTGYPARMRQWTARQRRPRGR